MNRFLLFALGALLTTVPAAAQVCVGNVTLRTQAEVNAFDCAEVTGNLAIGDFFGSSDIVDLTPLSALTAVGGDLAILGNGLLRSLAGLESLTSASDIQISDNDALVSLAGLENLTSIGSSLFLSSNDALVSLTGLENVTEIPFLGLESNPSLVSLTGLVSLSRVDLLQILLNRALVSLVGIESLTEVTEFRILENASLGSLAGLESLTSVGYLTILGNNALTSLAGLESLTSVGGDLEIGYNASLRQCSCGLSGLISGDPPAFFGVSGDVFVYENASDEQCTSPQVVLADTCTLPISGDLTAEATMSTTVPPGSSVGFKYAITNTAITPADGDLWFTVARAGTQVTQDVIRSGVLDAGRTVRGSFGQQVPENAPPGTYEYVLSVGQFPGLVIDAEVFEITVAGDAHAGGIVEAWSVTEVTPWEAVEEAEVALVKSASVVASSSLPEVVALEAAYPNPFCRSATLAFALPEEAKVRLTVYDVLGREVAVLVEDTIEAGSHTAVFDGQGLTSGAYLVRLVVGGTVQTQRLTLLR